MLELQRLPSGTAVALVADGWMSRRRLRRRAALAGVRVERELIVVPSTASPLMVLDDDRTAVRHFWAAVAAAPPGVTRAPRPAHAAAARHARPALDLDRRGGPGPGARGEPAVNAARPVQWSRRSAAHLLEEPEVRGVLISASRDPDAKLTFVVTQRPRAGR